MLRADSRLSSPRSSGLVGRDGAEYPGRRPDNFLFARDPSIHAAIASKGSEKPSHLSNAENYVRASRLLSLLTIAQPSPPVSKTFGSHCAPALGHSAIIFCARTQGRCNQHGMGKGIMG